MVLEDVTELYVSLLYYLHIPLFELTLLQRLHRCQAKVAQDPAKRKQYLHGMVNCSHIYPKTFGNLTSVFSWYPEEKDRREEAIEAWYSCYIFAMTRKITGDDWTTSYKEIVLIYATAAWKHWQGLLWLFASMPKLPLSHDGLVLKHTPGHREYGFWRCCLFWRCWQRQHLMMISAAWYNHVNEWRKKHNETMLIYF